MMNLIMLLFVLFIQLLSYRWRSSEAKNKTLFCSLFKGRVVLGIKIMHEVQKEKTGAPW